MKFRQLCVIFLFIAGFGFAQVKNPMENMYGNFNPDSLKPVTLTGKIIADSSFMNGMYFIDVNNDNAADYALIFGPDWYTPDSSKAVRPNVGDVVTIGGGLFNMLNSMPAVVVYSVNGNFWRSPFDSYWNEMGSNSMMGGNGHMGMDYSFGWNYNPMQSINVTGKVVVDSTFTVHHYYLDTNNDGKPDYFLNFGPPWQTTKSGVMLPSNDSTISISGGEMATGYMNMIIVYKMNGQVWQDSTMMKNNFGSGWIHKNMSQSQRFYNPFDSTDWMEVNPGWNGSGMMGGGMMPDSLYCQIQEVFPQNVPDDSSENTMAAFEVSTFYPNGMNGMAQSGNMGGQMNFNSMVNFQFHIDSLQAIGFNINGSNPKIKYWNNQTSQWVTLTNSTFNSSSNTVLISQNSVNNYYIITGEKNITGVSSVKNTVPAVFSLSQNYPNPFNPSTVISYQLSALSHVTLKVYDILGRIITTLVDGEMPAGKYQVNFNASNLSSGIYFYKLTTDMGAKVMKMEILK